MGWPWLALFVCLNRVFDQRIAQVFLAFPFFAGQNPATRPAVAKCYGKRGAWSNFFNLTRDCIPGYYLSVFQTVVLLTKGLCPTACRNIFSGRSKGK